VAYFRVNFTFHMVCLFLVENVFIYLFSYGLFNDALSISGCITLNGKIVDS
jgi:uncharacterized membrane protein